MPRDIARRRTSQNDESSMTDERTETRVRVTKEGSEPAPFGGGWSTDRAPRVRRTGAGTINRFKVEDGEEVLIKFLEADAPFASYWQHWIDKKPYTCLIENCPLCNIGDSPKPVDCFNVVKMTESGPLLYLWQASPDPAGAIKVRADNKRTSPLNRDDLYFAVSKVKGKNGFPSYNVDVVKAEELSEDWGMSPLTTEQMEAFQMEAYTSDAVLKSTPRHELVELANTLAD